MLSVLFNLKDINGVCFRLRAPRESQTYTLSATATDDEAFAIRSKLLPLADILEDSKKIRVLSVIKKGLRLEIVLTNTRCESVAEMVDEIADAIQRTYMAHVEICSQTSNRQD